MRTPVFILSLLLAGCSAVPHVKVKGVGEAHGVRDAGKPAELQQVTVPIPAGSIVTTEGQAVRVELVAPTTLTQVAATSGVVDASIAQHRADVEAKTKIAKQRVWIGTVLLLAGIVVGFALPGPMRWPIPGLLAAGVGAILVFMPDPPTWLVPSLLAAGAALVLAHYIIKHRPSHEA